MSELVLTSRIYIYLYISIIAILGSQRFLLESLYAYVCLLPLISSFFYYQKDRSASLVFLIISLFLNVDNGAGAYIETPTFLRYLIYLWSIFFIIQWGLISRSKFIIYLFLILPPLFVTIFGVNSIDIATLIRDIFVAVIVGYAIIQSGDVQKKSYIQWEFLAYFLTIYLLLEVLNVLFFYSIENGHYLSYDTLKGLIVFSFFYLIHHKEYLASGFVAAIIIFILMKYGSRMPLVMFFLVTSLYVVKARVKGFNIKRYFLLIFFLFVVFFIITNLSNNSKFGFMINQVQNVDHLIEWLMLIDPVRYFENLLFFERNIFSILFGNGFGSGLYDSKSYLGFVTLEETAFSAKELNSSMYYNFHDFWVDLGLRFGLLNILLFVFFITNRALKNSNNCYVELILLFLTFTVFYSTAGILLIAIFLMLSVNKASKQ